MIRNFKEKIRKSCITGFFVTYFMLTGLGVYSKINESQNPIRKIDNIRIASIEPYVLHSDLYFPLKRYKVKIEKREKFIDIDFSEKNLESLIKKGKLVMNVRNSLFVDGLEGI